MREENPDGPWETPNICQRFFFKLNATYQALKHPHILKFLGFLFLQGLTMPYFMAYDYVFAIKKLKIDIRLINLQGFFIGNLNFFIPWFYQKYYADRDFKYMFLISQRIFVMSDGMAAFLAMQWNQYLHIPNSVLYLLSGSIAQTLELGFQTMTAYIIFWKLVPVGIEATISMVYQTVLSLSSVALRETVGLLINDLFINVTNENLDNYVWLKVIGMCCNCIPFLFIYLGMVPTKVQADDL